MRHAIAFALAGGLAVSGCVEKERGQAQRAIDPAYVEANLLATPPAELTNQVNADFGGKVVYLGNRVDPTTVKPGQTLTVTHYWKVVEPPGPEWRIFTHVLGASGADWMNVDYSDMRAGHPASKWVPGQIIRDEQRIALRAEWTSPFAQVVVGLYRQGGQTAAQRMRVVTGPVDAESRVMAARLEVVGVAGNPERYAIRKATGPLEIDGRADEPDWQHAAESPPFLPTAGGPRLEQGTRARLLYDDTYLYAFVSVDDNDVYSEFTDKDGTLWKADVIELFIDADRSGGGYVELQVNPNNAQLDAWFAKTRATTPADFGWDANMRSAVTARGTAAERDDDDQGWDVEIALPLVAVKGADAAMKVTIPPAVGDTWKLNIVRVDKPKAAASILASSWSQIPIQDFHALDRLLTVVFADGEGKVPSGPPTELQALPPQAAPAGAPE
jgi:hypothetical protein